MGAAVGGRDTAHGVSMYEAYSREGAGEGAAAAPTYRHC